MGVAGVVVDWTLLCCTAVQIHAQPGFVLESCLAASELLRGLGLLELAGGTWDMELPYVSWGWAGSFSCPRAFSSLFSDEVA